MSLRTSSTLVSSVFVFGLFVSLGFGDTQLYSQKDWSLHLVQRTSPLENACVAMTEKAVGADHYRFYFAFDLNKNIAPAMFVTTSVIQIPENLTAQTDASSTKFRFYELDSVDPAFGEKTFWLAPQDFSKLFSQLRRDSLLRVSFKSGPNSTQKINLSLLGSMKTLDELKKQCGQGQDIAAEVFFDSLLKVKPNATTPVLGGGANELFVQLRQSWELFKAQTTQEASLKSVQAQIDPLVKRQQQLLANAGLLTQSIQQRQTKKDTLERRNIQLTSEIGSLKNQRTIKESELANAQTVFSQKEAVFKPVQIGLKPYTDALNQAQSQYQYALREVQNLNAQIQEAQDDLADLRAEQSQLNSRLNSKNQELSSLRSQRIQAESNLNSFNPQLEISRRLNNDWQYQNLLREIQTSRNSLAQLQSDLSHKQHDVQLALNDLRNCQSQAGADCSAAQASLSQAEGEVQRLQYEVQNMQRRISDLEIQADYRRRQIEDQVYRERQALVDRVTAIDIEINRVQTEITSIQTRLNQIQGQEIPDANRRLSNTQSLLSGAQARLQQAQNEINRAQRDLDQYKIANDYDRKRAEYDSAYALVRTLQSELNSIDSGIASRESEFNSNTVTVAKLTTEIENLIKSEAANNSEIQNLENSLAPLKAQKETLVQSIATISANRLTSDQTYRAAQTALDSAIGPMWHPSPLIDNKFWDWL